MPLTNSVIRRYTPPTCTLQIVDRNSALSRWGGRSETSSLQFELRFDDPRLPEEKRVSIQGDHYQLEALHQAVTSYVQDLLNSTPDKSNSLFWNQVSPASDAADSTSLAPDLDLTAHSPGLTETPQRLQPLEPSEHNPEKIYRQNQTTTSTGEIFLQPAGRRLTHNLFLGSLATEATGSVIQLSLLQLFDLATALDEYATEVVALTSLSHSARSNGAPSGIWAGIAAVLVLSVGITAVVLPMLNRSNQKPQLANNSLVPESSTNQEQISPQQQPSPSLPTTPPSSVNTLPPLPPPGSTNTSPSPSFNANLPGVSVPGTSPVIPNAPQANLPQTTPASPGIPQANLSQTTPASPLPTLTPPPSVLVNPVPRLDGDATISKQGDTSGTTDTQSPNFSISKVPNTIPPSLPQLSSPNSSTPTAPSPLTNDPATPNSSATSTTEQRLRSALGKQPSSNQNAPNESKTTRVATASAGPQIAQARAFFQKHWQPPAGLKQTLEYSLVLDVDGTIQRIEPLGEASRTYVDRSGMPLIGEPFVSPNSSGQTPRIRVVLSPNGKVQTFQETE